MACEYAISTLLELGPPVDLGSKIVRQFPEEHGLGHGRTTIVAVLLNQVEPPIDCVSWIHQGLTCREVLELGSACDLKQPVAAVVLRKQVPPKLQAISFDA